DGIVIKEHRKILQVFDPFHVRIKSIDKKHQKERYYAYYHCFLGIKENCRAEKGNHR
ncbi:unnamed protein product, partial [marine sediment metagenome]